MSVYTVIASFCMVVPLVKLVAIQQFKCPEERFANSLSKAVSHPVRARSPSPSTKSKHKKL